MQPPAPAEQPLRILHLSGRPAWCGESNRVLVECRGLQARGHEVLLATSPGTALVERALEGGVPLCAEFRFARGFRPAALLHDVARLRRLLRERTFDVVHAHTPRDTWPAALALGARGRLARPLYVRTKHHSLPTLLNVPHRWLYGARVDQLILAGERLRESVAPLTEAGVLTPDRLHVLHSSIDVRRFDPQRVTGDRIRQEFGLGDRLVIGLVGRVSREKGHEVLLDALTDLPPGPRGWTALIVGEGDQLEPLRARVAAGPLRDRVIFTGPRRDIPEIVAALDVLVMPSLWLEASPAVIKEGMAMNVAVIASDVGGAAEIVTDGTDGWIVPPGQADALRAALVRCLTDEPARQAVARRGRETIVNRFSDERLVEGAIALYRSMLAGRRT